MLYMLYIAYTHIYTSYPCCQRKFRNVLPDYGNVLARGTVAPRVRKGKQRKRKKARATPPLELFYKL